MNDQSLILPETEGKTPEEMRAKILQLEEALLAQPKSIAGSPGRIDDLPVNNHFACGVYMRELPIPKNMVLTGKIHKTEHLAILSQGDVSVWTEGGMKRLKASSVIKSNPGMKRVIFAHEDSVWITVHPNPTDQQNIEEIEDRLVTETFEKFLAFMNQGQIEGGK